MGSPWHLSLLWCRRADGVPLGRLSSRAGQGSWSQGILSIRIQVKSGGNSQGIARASLIRSTSSIHAYCCLSCPSLMPPVVWHSCICCANMEQNVSGRGGVFAAGGSGEKLSWGVQHKAGSGWRRGRNVGSSRTIQHQHNSMKRQKAPRKAPWTMAHKRPLALQDSFFTISIFHAHLWLWALHCRAPSAPTSPSLSTQQTCDFWMPVLGLLAAASCVVGGSGWWASGSVCVLETQR